MSCVPSVVPKPVPTIHGTGMIIKMASLSKGNGAVFVFAFSVYSNALCGSESNTNVLFEKSNTFCEVKLLMMFIV